MGARLLTAVGALTLVVAFALLIVTCASIPNTSLPLLTVDAHNDRRGATGGEIRVQFGLWGWCQHTSEVWGTHPEGCVKGNGTSGYNPAVVMRGLNEDFPSFNTAGSARDLTLGFVLPAVAIATTGVAIILAIAWLIKRNLIIYIAILTFSVLSFIFTIAAVGCVFGFCEKIRKGTPARTLVWVGTSRSRTATFWDLKTYYGPCVVTLALACGVLLVATIILFFAWLVSKREGRRTWSEGVAEKHRVSHSEVAPSSSEH
ncbi:hypothetical protein CGCSCA4_v011001 [Colletotrichum siamense]|uniref:Pali-domain-containing protein n=1 Tax=Colletotrichum siamense TaxID=690259 RepID=A0A9P5K1B2_COLSI|nr:hypothetical protein CGCSCA4_v011001 [Colletotrichum siamense]KAF4853895.1 hypothetical protein CGCSCA2_v009764 [Colletotrichum siamense]